MSFNLIAKNLLKPTPTESSGPSSRLDFLQKLSNAGFSDDEIIQLIRQEYDATEDTTERKQLLDMIIKMRGLYTTKDAEKSAPVFNINIKGDNDKIYQMLCPPQAEAA